MANHISINTKASGTQQLKPQYSDLTKAQKVAMDGIKNQNFALRIIAENLANAGSTASTPGGDPYRRQIVTMIEEKDRKTGANTVKVNNVKKDTKSQFRVDYDPAHPAADPETGQVKRPNVEPIVEMVDMMQTKEQKRALLKVYKVSTTLEREMLDLIR